MSLENLSKRVGESLAPEHRDRPADDAEPSVDLIVVGASTGGPPALQSIFQKAAPLSVPFVVAQHMPPTFTRLFAERVDRLSRYRVREGRDGDLLEQGTVYVAPGGMQTEIAQNDGQLALRVFEPSERDLYSPSVNRLFSSAAEIVGSRLIAIVLTGMGDDGSGALGKVRTRGGRTIAESETSAIIYGMPREAIKTGFVDEIVPLSDIPERLRQLCLSC